MPQARFPPAFIIGPLVGKSQHHIVNSKDFVDKIKDIQLEEGETITSYDVSALFTCVPPDEAVDVVKEFLINDNTLSERTKLNPDQVCSLKDTHTDQYLLFDSHHPLVHKLGVIKTLFHRADTISSNEDAKTKEHKHLKSALGACGYRKWTFEKALHKPKSPTKDDASHTATAGEEKRRHNVTIPYVSELSEKIRRIFRGYQIPVSFKPTNTLRQKLVHPKDKVPKDKQNNLVYAIPCTDNGCKDLYIGETKQPLAKRMYQHRRASSGCGDSAVYSHLNSTNHTFDNKDVVILDRESRCNKDITELPERMGDLKSLYTLKLEGIMIKKPPGLGKLCNNGDAKAKEITRALRERLFNIMPYRGVKLVVMGPEKSGKTTLLQQLSSRRITSDNEVNVFEWTLTKPGPSLPKADRIDFTVWDLKGSFENASIMRTLLTSNTVYLLVWDIQDKRKKTMDHIKDIILNVKFQAPGCSIIAVGTHADLVAKRDKNLELAKNLDQSDLLRDLIYKEEFVDASKRYGVGMNVLIKTIHRFTSDMKTKQGDALLGRQVPAAYIRLKENLQQHRQQKQGLGQPVMSHEEFLKEMVESGMDESDVNANVQNVQTFLRESGSLIHVSDHTYGLNNLYFLDPNWLCKLLLSVINLEMGRETTTAKVKRKELMKLCKEFGFGNSFKEYQDILSRFDIAVQIDKDSFLRPFHLQPRQSSTYSRDAEREVKSHTLKRWYTMELIPPGFWGTFVCRLVGDVNQRARYTKRGSNRAGDNKVDVWMDAVSLSQFDGKTEVKLVNFTSDESTSGCNAKQGISVSVQSRDELDFQQRTGFIVDHIDYLLRHWYPDMDGNSVNSFSARKASKEAAPERIVPCPECVKAGKVKFDEIHKRSYFFNFKDLVEAVTEKRQNVVSCKCHGHLIRIQDIAPDILLLDLGVKALSDRELKEIEQLGKGGYGVVYKVKFEGRELALKSLVNEDSDLKNFTNFRKEVVTTCQMKHPCIIELIGVSVEKLSFALELAPFGDLHAFIEGQMASKNRDPVEIRSSQRFFKGTPLDRLFTFKIVFQITSAVDYLHREGVIHTDLKTDNVMVFSTDTDQCINVKLADYGISQRNIRSGVVRGGAGRHAFVAPEIGNNKAYNEKADIFSIGMIVLHLLSGVSPAGNEQNITATLNTADGERRSFKFKDFQVLPNFKQMEEVMELCWKEQPQERPSAADILRRMRKPQFLCLYDAIYLQKDENEKALCFSHSFRRGRGGEEYLWIWSHNKNDITTRTRIDVGFPMFPAERSSLRVPVVNSAITFDSGSTHLVSHSAGISMLTIQDKAREVHQGHDVTSLLLVQVRNTVEHFIYAGTEDGTMLVFKQKANNVYDHIKVIDLPISHLSNMACRCMLYVEEESLVLVGCGKSIIQISAESHTLLEKQLPSLSSFIKGIAYSGGNIWCFLNDSPDLHCFNIKACKVNTFRGTQYLHQKMMRNRIGIEKILLEISFLVYLW
ncbi:leucine-rich repeat serine/threonine-protein kinase 1-like [Amphiura filiformis]|uniref:leucine-rich repeat serine/threonine-protein kinase 1-like n=1 Tax=Amphiura filiformis TaxID=82378 RepID=UPI003B20F104